MDIATASQMKQIDERAIHHGKIPGIVLMENAAMSIYNEVQKRLVAGQTITVLCGCGNNGGDGFALARHLANAGLPVAVVILGSIDSISGDALTELTIIRNMALQIQLAENYTDSELAALITQSGMIIDAILGIGFKGALSSNILAVIQLVNQSQCPVIAVDIPTGVDADTGVVVTDAILADCTVTFGLAKPGILLYPGSLYAGSVELYPISIPSSYIQRAELKLHVLNEQEAALALPVRLPYSNKGTYGRAAIFAGSATMPGAAILCGRSAYQCGVGLVDLHIPKSIAPVVQTGIVEAVTTLLPDTNEPDLPALLRASAVAAGPGLGTGGSVKARVEWLILNCTVPLILDADALNAIADNPQVLKQAKPPIAITPHIGEFSRLTGLSVRAITSDIVAQARHFAAQFNVIVVLKDARTIIAHPSGHAFINVTGHNALAKGGSGDVLTGTITAFAASGMQLFDACVLGCYVHGLAGETAAKKLGAYSVCASDTADALAPVLNTLSAKE